jgi:SAM-dependent methyltransferase
VNVSIDITRWLGPADRADHTVLARCLGPVLDVGCGPGRLVRALAERGVAALGVDLAPVAVMFTRQRGAIALRRNVFARVPGEGRWPTALLIDGNIGIGGDVMRLLRRMASLLAHGGRLLVEADPHGRDQALTARFRAHGQVLGEPVSWARASLGIVHVRGAEAGLRAGETWAADGRIFTVLHRT